MDKKTTVQDLLQEVLLEQNSDDNEMLQVLEFMRDNGVPLSSQQAAGIFMLQHYGLGELGNYVMNVRTRMTPVKRFFELVNKLTLADRIKGNAKLGNLLKANANPANSLNTDKALAKNPG